MANNVVHTIRLKAESDDDNGGMHVTVAGLEEFLLEVKDATGGYDDPVISVSYDGLTYEYEEN